VKKLKDEYKRADKDNKGIVDPIEKRLKKRNGFEYKGS
jgi:hypothetical protein